MHPHFKKVFDYLKVHDLTALPVGRVEIDGGRVWLSVSEVQGREKAEARLEVHDEYIDIQLPLLGPETYGWRAREDLMHGMGDGGHAAADLAFYSDEPSLYLTLVPGEFVVFFPEDGHAPCIAEGTVKKIVAKVRKG